MKNKTIRIILFTIVLGLSNTPVYGSGYEDVSLANIIFKLVFYLLAMGLVIFLTLYGTKIIGKGLRGFGTSKYISILDIINLPGGSKIVITKIGEKVYILSTNSTNTSVIDIFNEDEFIIKDEHFDNYLNKYLDKGKNRNVFSVLLNKAHNKKDKEDNNDEEKY